MTGALVAFAASIVFSGGADPAVATDGQPILAGEDDNTETSATFVRNTFWVPEWADCYETDYDGAGLVGCGYSGLTGVGTSWGLLGIGASNGVRGFSPNTGVFGNGNIGVWGRADQDGDTGVFGSADIGLTGIGVHGKASGVGSAVYGENLGQGAGVFGDAPGGTGVQARSTNGKALRVLGQTEFSRSGVTTIAAGNRTKRIYAAAVTDRTFVLATIQGNQSGVWLQGVVPQPAGGFFVIHLNKAATSGLRVAWFISERP